MSKKINLTRAELIIMKADNQYSYAEMGEKLGVSKQRIYQIIKNYKGIPRNTKVRTKVFLRDGFTCQWGERCPKESKRENLVIHHLDSNTANNRLDNLITLCKWCHVYFHGLVRLCSKIK